MTNEEIVTAKRRLHELLDRKLLLQAEMASSSVPADEHANKLAEINAISAEQDALKARLIEAHA